MKETKVYVDKMPKWYSECPCNYDTYCQLHELNHYGEDNYHCKSCFDKRPKDCPLIDIKTHDRELVKEVCEKISIELENETGIYCEIRQCNSPHYQGDYVWFNYVKFRKLAEKLQKEFEK